MRISVIGSGYVGLVAGACFADTGNTVYCVDKDERKIAMLKNGEIPIYEPGLETLVKRGYKEGRLKFTTNTAEAVADSEIVFMAVGTPPTPSGDPDLSFLKAASEEVARSQKGYVLVVNKSTVPIGSHKVVADWMKPHTQHDYDVVSNPEFLKEGSALDDFLKPDRVVIGTYKKEAYNKMAELYAPFVRQGNPVIWMDPISAEITKYACNAFLATKISFVNELANLCEKVGGDVELVRKGMTSDIRIGKHFLYPGAGYGGSCFPKDVQALMATGRKEGVPLGIVEAVEDANARQKKHLVEIVSDHYKGNLKGKTFAIWGLAFKPNTDDIREAPSLVIIEELLKAGATVRAFDPVAAENVKQILGDRVTFCSKSFEAVEGADALVLVTEWNEFRHVNLDQLKSVLKEAVIFDGRNIFDPMKVRDQGFTYYGIGRTTDIRIG